MPGRINRFNTRHKTLTNGTQVCHINYFSNVDTLAKIDAAVAEARARGLAYYNRTMILNAVAKLAADEFESGGLEAVHRMIGPEMIRAEQLKLSMGNRVTQVLRG